MGFHTFLILLLNHGAASGCEARKGDRKFQKEGCDLRFWMFSLLPDPNTSLPNPLPEFTPWDAAGQKLNWGQLLLFSCTVLNHHHVWLMLNLQLQTFNKIWTSRVLLYIQRMDLQTDRNIVDLHRFWFCPLFMSSESLDSVSDVQRTKQTLTRLKSLQVNWFQNWKNQSSFSGFVEVFLQNETLCFSSFFRVHLTWRPSAPKNLFLCVSSQIVTDRTDLMFRGFYHFKMWESSGFLITESFEKEN